MTKRLLVAFLAAVVLAAVFRPAAIAAAPASCASLASIALPDTTVRSAEEVAGPSFSPPGSAAISNLPRFCRVAATTKPAVNFEVWLPLANWNGRFQGVGNGANAGYDTYGAMAAAIQHGPPKRRSNNGHLT